jgi:uncharacterized membrane protein YphA (DoxX/SURF4 family)
MQEPLDQVLEAKYLAPAGATLLMIGLGGIAILSLISGDFAYTWQPVPKALPAREVLARLTGVLLLTGIFGTLATPIRTGALRLLLTLMLGWLLLHLPAVIARPLNVGAWLGVAEIGAVSLGMRALLLRAQGSAENGCPWVFRLFGAAAIVFGSSHFAYPQITAGLVPTWIPGPLFWAYATGAAHILGGIALLGGFRPRLAAAALGAMYLSWVFVLHGGRLFVAPASRLEWTMLFVASMISGAAFLVSSLGFRTGREGTGMHQGSCRSIG